MEMAHFRRHRRILGLTVLMAIAMCASIVALLLAGGASSQPSSAEERQIRSQFDLWLSLDDATWPAPAYASQTVPKSFVDQSVVHENQVLKRVATDNFAAEDSKNPMILCLQEVRSSGGEFAFACEHKLLSLAYAGTADDGKQLYRAEVWQGETRGTWSADQRQLVDVNKVDSIIRYQVTMVSTDGVWKIDDARILGFQGDADPNQYGPDTPHDPFWEF